MGALRSDFRTRHETEEARRVLKETKTFADKFGEDTLMDIMTLCNAPSLDQVAPFWQKLAEAPKSQQLVTLQKALDKKKKDMNERGLQVIASPSLLNTIKTLQLGMVDNNALDTGLNPFRLYEEPDEVQARTNQAVYFIAHNNGGAPSLTDAATTWYNLQVQV